MQDKIKKIINEFGMCIKWFGIVEILASLFSFFYIKAFYELSGITAFLFTILIFALLSFVGYKMEKYGGGKSAATVEEPGRSSLRKSQKAPAERKVRTPVINRDEKVSGGEYIYRFINGKDLFTGSKEEYAYPELPRNFRVAANLAKHILDEGGSIQGIYIGGGCDEVSHTGAVAYKNSYSTLDAFVQNSMKDIGSRRRRSRNEIRRLVFKLELYLH